MEATVLLAKFGKKNQTYGMRTQKMDDGDWWRTWAFPINEHRARREGYDRTTITGNLYHTEKYPGCTFCGAKNFVQCNKCHKNSCWNGEPQLECPWCGNDMNNIATATEKFNLLGEDY